ncbi:MAG: hypothetical protein HRT69_09730 [Flavobacteriaceae bacterium]|nr:hypothetical protein [Flavobacteriaceae bacterium]
MKTIKLLFVAIIGSLLSVSCLVEDDAPQQEFTQTPYSVRFATAAQSTGVPINNGVQNIEIPVDLVGGGNWVNTPALQISYTIDVTSTAVAGTHYTAPSGTIDIAENSDFGYLTIPVNSDNFTSSTNVTIVIELTSNSNGIVVSSTQTTITLAGLCVSDLGGTYDVSTTSGAGDGAENAVPLPFASTVVITDNGNGNYTMSDYSAGIYSAWYTGVYNGAENAIVPGVFQDICGSLSGNFDAFYANETVILTGTDNGDGTLTIYWTMPAYGETATATYTKQ